MRRKKAKFKIGDTVMDTMSEERFVVETVHFDPCDGWKYGPEPGAKKFLELYFEVDLELISN
jgi:hypothetical protein